MWLECGSLYWVSTKSFYKHFPLENNRKFQDVSKPLDLQCDYFKKKHELHNLVEKKSKTSMSPTMSFFKNIYIVATKNSKFQPLQSPYPRLIDTKFRSICFRQHITLFISKCKGKNKRTKRTKRKVYLKSISFPKKKRKKRLATTFWLLGAFKVKRCVTL